MAKSDILKPELWSRRSVEDTVAVYRDWAESYDADITARGYRTPDRIAAALVPLVDPDTLILDFGCGTGLSGKALAEQGYHNLHGTDITPEMLEKARATGLYAKLWTSDPGKLTFGRRAYLVIVAAGVVSLGAAPPETLPALVAKLGSGGLLALSYNAPTLADEHYVAALSNEIAAGHAEVVFRENGPHLDNVGMTSDVIVLRRP